MEGVIEMSRYEDYVNCKIWFDSQKNTDVEVIDFQLTQLNRSIAMLVDIVLEEKSRRDLHDELYK